MTYSVRELLEIHDLPDYLRSENCFNDLQHSMLVILFRHSLTALKHNKLSCADNMIDTSTLYLYIHFLNEEEGMAYQMEEGFIQRDELAEHSQTHIRFLDQWRDSVFLPYKRRENSAEETIENLATFYNAVISHIEHTDIPTYGDNVMSVEQTRHELARISHSNMPMSPFMPGAFQTLNLLCPEVADALDAKRLSPCAMTAMKDLNLVRNVGRILKGQCGSLRDRFAEMTGGDISAALGATQLYTH